MYTHFLEIDSTMFIKLIVEYTSSIVWKVFFGFICLTLTWNTSLKNVQQNHFIKTDWNKKNCYISATASNASWQPILEYTLGIEYAKGGSIVIMIAFSTTDTLGIAVVDETNDGIFLKEVADDIILHVRWCDIVIHVLN